MGMDFQAVLGKIQQGTDRAVVVPVQPVFHMEQIPYKAPTDQAVTAMAAQVAQALSLE
jgi:hypothetical protein